VIGLAVGAALEFLPVQVVCAMDYCHRFGIAHRDLKLENTLLMKERDPHIKICDFG
jgi:serine/threonine protein kinase